MERNTKQQCFFNKSEKKPDKSPLAVRMRPRSLNDLIGQVHILGKDKILRRVISSGQLPSLILYGPPGTGKTSLGYCLKEEAQADFVRINAVSAKVSDLRRIIEQAELTFQTQNNKTILFIDEIHRFNRVQQDVLLPSTEEGRLVMVGATVYNPFFSVISGLISRCLILEFKPLDSSDIKSIIMKALSDADRGLGKYSIDIDPEALEYLAANSQGDARRALSALEVGSLSTPPDKEGVICYTKKVAEESLQKKAHYYQATGDEHYDMASAFIKSMRGSDPDATLYWMVRMLEAGEDPRFIVRRIAICASEDVGNADPRALQLAHSTLGVCELVGLPEAELNLAQAAVYVACAPKSNAVYEALGKVKKYISENPDQEVPLHLRDSSYEAAEGLGRGISYKYPHQEPTGYIDQDYMQEKVTFYSPKAVGFEKKIKQRLQELRKDAVFNRRKEKGKE